MPKPQIATKRTSLVPIGSGDIATTHALWTHPAVRKYLWDDVVVAKDRAAEVVAASDDHFARHGYGLWTVRDPQGGALMGVCGFRPTEVSEPELLFAFWPQYWGLGFANETARALIAYVFELLGRPQIVAATDVPNDASIRALQRLGMQREGRGTLNGLDTYFYRLTREQFQSEPGRHCGRGQRFA